MSSVSVEKHPKVREFKPKSSTELSHGSKRDDGAACTFKVGTTFWDRNSQHYRENAHRSNRMGDKVGIML